MKKLLSACLAILMLLSSLSIMASAALNLHPRFDKDDTYTVGDINGDKASEPNAMDSNLIKRYFLGKDLGEEKFVEDAADINADGVINSKDSYLLKSIIAGTKTTADFDNNQQIYKLTIGGVDISEFSIYAPSLRTYDNASYSAELMKEYIEEATGIELKIKTGKPEGNAIVFNLIPRIAEVDPDKRDELTEAELEKYQYGEELGTDGYQYKVENGSLYVYGTYRGNMYAVYEILENYLGYRFYDSRHTFIYKSRTVDIPEGLDSGIFQPAFKFRYCGAHVRGDNAQVYYFPSRMNGSQILGYSEEEYGTKYGPQGINAHSYEEYWKIGIGELPEGSDDWSFREKYHAKLVDGANKWKAAHMDERTWQPCASSEEAYQALFCGMIYTIKHLSEVLKPFEYDFTGRSKKYVRDGQKSMSFSLCDNESYCTCRYCRSTARKEGYGALYLDMANRAARELQEYDGGKYAGMRTHCILYNHDIPKTIVPDKNVIVFYCGQGCNNHVLGTDDCGDCYGQKPVKSMANVKYVNNKFSSESLKAWGELCKQTGAEMWYWYYGVQYAYVLVDMPNVLNLYYDIKFLYEECNVKGIYYEGCGRPYGFEKLKEYLAMKMIWEPTMTYERYTEHIKEYLYMYYGDGYEYLYQLILMQDEAAKNCGTCFISNFDRPGDMFSLNYMRTHYEEMRQLIVSALEAAEKEEHIECLKTMLTCFDFLGLSYVYYDVYKGEKATAETKALFEQRYTDMYNHITVAKWRGRENESHVGLDVYGDKGVFFLPSEIDFDICPILQIYGDYEYDKDGNLIGINPCASCRKPINDFFLYGKIPVVNDDPAKKDENGALIPVYNDGIPEPATVKFGNTEINY